MNVVGNMRKAIHEKNLIEPGDRVAVGVSGGKDSMALLAALHEFQRYSPIPYELEAITISPGFEGMDFTPVEEFCAERQIPYTIHKTNIADVVFDIREESNPCALCANMRRGALAGIMNDRNLNVLALGHHADDLAATFFMNMLYTGRLNTLPAKSYLDRSKIHVIRPLINVPESWIKGFIKKKKLPVVESTCPVDKRTNREDIEQLLNDLYKKIPISRQNIQTALRNEEQFNLFE